MLAWIISTWKQPKCIHRRSLYVHFPKHSLLYTQFIILDCIYKTRMFPPHPLPWKIDYFHSELFYRDFSEPVLSSHFLFLSQQKWDFTVCPCELITHSLARFDVVTFIDRLEAEGAVNEKVMRFLFTCKWQIKLASEHEIAWKASWRN